MYKDGMSASEVTCYSDSCATYNCSRHVIHRHDYTSAAYLYTHASATYVYSYGYPHSYAYGYTDSGAANGYSYSNTIAATCPY